ncbi:MAG TPA: hypothetical protein VM715_06610 [Candidatus Acidoferrum sp.]|jgi:hypothetical protein|nr:hypothetical protein [Candidatus Acidoferrum sp.]
MNKDDSYQNGLLRMLIGYFHVSGLQQLSLVRHGKAFHLLDQEEKTKLEAELISAVAEIARQAKEQTVLGLLKPPAPTGPIQ